MGNAGSLVDALNIPDEIQWKTGAISNGIPSPDEDNPFITYETLQTSVNFKSFLLKHLDSEGLISSILSNVEDNNLILKGFEKYRSTEPELVEEVNSLVNNFQQCVTAGLKIKPTGIADVIDKEVSTNFKATNSLFLASFQKRIACLKFMLTCIEKERQNALATTPLTKPVERVYGNDDRAQLSVLISLQSAGLSLLKVFPMCFATLHDDYQRNMLTEPIIKLCEPLGELQDLALFSTCSENMLEQRRERWLEISKSAVISGVPPDIAAIGVFNYIGTEGWECHSSKLDFDMHTRQNISVVRFCWTPPFFISPLTTIPPKRVMVFADVLNPEGVRLSTICVLDFSPEEVHSRTKSWIQTFDLSLQCVVHLSILFYPSNNISNSKNINSSSSTSGSIGRLYGLRLGLMDDHINGDMNPLPMLSEVQQALLPVTSFSTVSNVTYTALFAIVRSTGSLGLLLNLIYALITDTTMEKTIQNQVPNAIFSLLTAMYTVENKVRNDYNEKYCITKIPITTIRFISDDRKSDSIEINSQEKLSVYFTSLVLSNGSYEWDFTIVNEITGDESIFIGIGSKLLHPESILTSTDAYMIRCYNGELFQSKRCPVPAITAIHCGDICTFRYDSKHRSLSLKVNNIDQGILFENVPSNLVPCVLFQKSTHRRTVRIDNVYQLKGNWTEKNKPDQKLPDRPPPELSDVYTTKSIAELILTSLCHLAETTEKLAEKDQNTSLIYPFCTEVRLNVFAQLVILAQTIQLKQSEETSSMLHSIFTVMKLHFSCIYRAKAPLTDVGFYIEDYNTPIILESLSNIEEIPLKWNYSVKNTSPIILQTQYNKSTEKTWQNCLSGLNNKVYSLQLLKIASKLLQDFMKNTSQLYVLQANTVFCSGFSLFLPSPKDRIILLIELLQETQGRWNGGCRKESNVNMKPCTPVRWDLIIHLINRYKATKEVLSLIQMIKNDTESSLLVIEFVKSLLDVQRMLSQSRTHCPNPWNTEEHTSTAQNILCLLSTFQEQLYCELLSSTQNTVEQKEAISNRNCFSQILVIYTKSMISHCIQTLEAPRNTSCSHTHSKEDAALRESPVGVLLHPLLHALALPGLELNIYQEVSSDLVKLLSVLSVKCEESPDCRTAVELVQSVITSSSKPQSGNVGYGWHTIKAAFEEGESSFSVSENGTVYTAATTSNTCAVVTTRFTSKQKAAWEFLLESDSSGDECSTFGAARCNFTNRCYSSSPDLYMRRAYNGYMYALGQSTGNTMDKIKPGDTLRVEFDGKAGTLSFGLNGGDMQVGFTGVTDDIYPACGSYRNGVVVRLLKVEVFDAMETAVEGDVTAELAFIRPTADIKWILNEESYMNVRDSSLLTPGSKGGKPKVTVNNRWVTARGDRGALYGVHDWTFEMTASQKSQYSFGVVVGGNPYPFDRLAGPCLKISSKTPKDVAVLGSTVVLNSAGGQAFAPAVQTSSSVRTDTNTEAATTRTVPPSPVSSLYDNTGAPEPTTTSTPLEQVEEIPFSRTHRYLPGHTPSALAWHSDGSLWCDGVKRANSFGLHYLPLTKGSIVGVRVNRSERTVSYFVNGAFVGIAFGPENSGAAVTVPLPEEQDMNASSTEYCADISALTLATVFPAASVNSSAQAIRIRSGGFSGSTVLPLILSMQKSLLSCIGRISGMLIQGPPVSPAEVTLMPWFASNLMIGGLEVTDTTATTLPITQTNDPICNTLTPVELLQYLSSYVSYTEGDLATERVRSIVKAMWAWMETIDPEPAFLRNALERSGTYSFPSVEAPFVACLLKHSGLVIETVDAIRWILRSGPTGAGDLTETVSGCVASREMVSLWQRVKQLRVYLRHQRQTLKNKQESTVEAVEKEEVESTASDKTVIHSSPIVRSDHPLLFPPSSDAEEEEELAELDWRVTVIDALSAGTWNPGSWESLLWTKLPKEDPSLLIDSEHYIHFLCWGVQYQTETVYVRIPAADLSCSINNICLQCDEILLNIAEIRQETQIIRGERVISLGFKYTSIRENFYSTLLSSNSNKLSLTVRNSEVKVLLGCIDIGELLKFLNHYYISGSFLSTPTSSSNAEPNSIEELKERHFHTFCSTIIARSKFLLQLAPASIAADGDDYKAKALLRNLTKKYSGILPASGTNEDLSRWRAQERWKRVIEFLHTKSKSNKKTTAPTTTTTTTTTIGRISTGIASMEHNTTTSSSNSTGRVSPFNSSKIAAINSIGRFNSKRSSEQDNSNDVDTPVQAALHACTVFLLTQGLTLPSCELNKVLSIRQNRAKTRVYGLHILRDTLNIPQIRRDILSVSPLLSYFKPSLEVHLPKDVTSDRTLQLLCDKYHYLSTLEGCGADALLSVQEGFVDMFKGVVNMLNLQMRLFLSGNQESLAGGIAAGSVTGIAADAESVSGSPSRNDPHVLGEALCMLMEMWTLHFSTRDHKWLDCCGLVDSLTHLTSTIQREHIAAKWLTVAERSVAFLRANFQYTSEKNWHIWSSDTVQEGLHSGSIPVSHLLHHIASCPDPILNYMEEVKCTSFNELLHSHRDGSRVLESYCQILAKVNNKQHLKEIDEKRLESERVAEEERKTAEMLARITPCGVFEQSFTGRHIKLSGYNLEASIADDGGGTAVCSFTNIKYDAATSCQSTGNYFEVTIQTLGRKAIGIGLADRNVFSFTNYMPGWEPHSYGYHGDDGKKFGAHKTPGDWPLFEVGDVIGCGIDYIRHSIFYTRNGILLGDGFIGITETALWPVVGFSNRNRQKEAVKINFGLEPFLYESSSVHGHPRAIEVGALLEQERNAKNTTKSSTTTTTDGGVIEEFTHDIIENISEINPLCCKTMTEYMRQDREIALELRAAETQWREYTTMTKHADLVLRFLLTLSCRSDETGRLNNPRSVEPTLTSGITKLKLTKDVSLYGTPMSLTSSDSISFQQSIIANCFTQIVASTESITAISANTETIALGLDEITSTLHSYLLILATHYDGSPSIREAMGRTKILRALFLITELSHVKNRDLSFRLLNKILPSTQPEIVDAALGESLLMVVQQHDIRLQDSVYRKRLGKMPINTIQALQFTAADALVMETLPSSRTHSLPKYGSGTRALEVADCKLLLLQTLFASPHWTELVACVLTDSFRNASTAIERYLSQEHTEKGSLTVVHEEKSTEQDSIHIDILKAASAACAILSCLTLRRNGARVTVSNTGEKAIILSCSELTNTTTLVYERDYPHYEPLQEITTVNTSILEPIIETVTINLADLSQPLLQQFFGMLEKLLHWFQSIHNTHEPSNNSTTIEYNLLLRLTSLSSLALSQLLVNQSEVVNFIHDSHIITDLVSISLCPSELHSLHSLLEIQLTGQIAQMRCLELNQQKCTVVTSPQEHHSHNIEENLHPSAEGEEKEEINTSGTGNKLHTVDKLRLKTAINLSKELDFDEKICKLFVDFYDSRDPEPARQALLRLKEQNKLVTIQEEMQSFTTPVVLSSDIVTFDDQNVLNKITTADPNTLTTTTTSSSDHAYNLTTTISVEYHLLDVTEYLFRLVANKITQCPEEIILLVRTNIEGATTTLPGPVFYTSLKELYKANTTTDPSIIIMRYSDPTLAYNVAELVTDIQSVRVVNTLFNGVELQNIRQYRAQLDGSLTTQCLRRVTAKLLADGNLNLHRDLPCERKVGSLLKLIVASEPESFDKVVPALCSTLAVSVDDQMSIPHSNEDSPSGNLLLGNSMVQEITDGLQSLSMLSLSNCTTSSKQQQLTLSDPTETSIPYLEYASPHPFPAPHKTMITIQIPPEWRNLSIQFHPKCRTPSHRARLQFFTSLTDYHNEKVLFELYGDTGNWEAMQNKYIPGPIEKLYCNFIAEPASNLRDVKLLPIDGPIDITEKTVSIDRSAFNGKVGLGEDDSLFNLFNTDESESAAAITACVSCDISYLIDGVWYFEATITAGVDDLENCAIGIVAEDFTTSVTLTDAPTTLCVLSGALGGELNLQGNRLNCFGQQGHWNVSDVIGCLFQLTESVVSVWFSKNGVWSDQINGEVSTVGWRPFFQVAGSAQAMLNFGEKPFTHPPPPEVVRKTSTNSYQHVLQSRISETTDEAWGYHFIVRPFTNLRMKMCTSFDLVKKVNAEPGDGEKVWIWRPKASGSYLPWGDLITTSEFPPDRTFLVDSEQCQRPVSMSMVFTNSKIDLTIRRLRPPDGYVSLGDVACSGTMPATEAKVLCIPKWAVRESDATRQLCALKKCGSSGKESTGTLWSIQDGLGGFRGSPFESRHSLPSDHDAKYARLDHFGVGQCHVLRNSLELKATMCGGWSCEVEVLTQPSLKWTLALLRYMLDTPGLRSRVLTPTIFDQLVKFLRSNVAPTPLVAVPPLIHMIRLAQREKVKLPLENIKQLCKSILQLALVGYSGRHHRIPLALMKLVDFVVEVQIAHTEASYDKDAHFAQFQRFLTCSDYTECTQILHQSESKEENADFTAGIESKESEPLVFAGQGLSETEGIPSLVRQYSDDAPDRDSLTTADFKSQLEDMALQVSGRPVQSDWWNRVPIPPVLIKLHRGIKYSVVQDVFRKESTIMRLRQALKFIKAIEHSRVRLQLQSSAESSTSVVSVVPRPYPRFMSSKLWNEHAYSSVMEESSHPYRIQTYSRCITVPGAETVHIIFDRRCALALGDRLTITQEVSSGLTAVFMLSSTTTEQEIEKGLTISGCKQLTFTFEATMQTSAGAVDATEKASVNPDNLWGWSCMLYAAGRVYEFADKVLNLNEVPVSQQAEVQGKEADKDKGEPERLQDLLHALLPHIPSTATEGIEAGVRQLLDSMKALVEVPKVESEYVTIINKLVCMAGKLLCEGHIATPMAHAMRINLDHITSTSSSNSSSSPAVEMDNTLKVFRGTPVFAPRTGISEEKPAGASFRTFISKSFQHASCDCRGDCLKYQVFGMAESEFVLWLVGHVDAITPVCVPSPPLPPTATPPIVATAVEPEVDVVTDDAPEVSFIEEMQAEAEVPPAELSDDAIAAPAEADAMWDCAVCTLLNPPHVHECTVCGTMRPGREATEVGSGSGAAAGADAAAGWWCNSCTFINPLSDARCSMCGTARDGGTPAAAATQQEQQTAGGLADDESSRSTMRSSDHHETSEDEDDDGEDDYEDGDFQEDDDDANHPYDTDRRAAAAGFVPIKDTQSDLDKAAGTGITSRMGRISADSCARIMKPKPEEDLLLVMVEGVFTAAESFEARLLGAIASRGDILTPAQMNLRLGEWTVDADSDLIDQMNALGSATNALYKFALPKKYLAYCSPALAAKSLLHIQYRAQHIEEFNKHLEHLLPFIDLGNADPCSLGSMIRKCNRYLLLKVKTPLLDAAISSSVVQNGRGIPAPLVLDNSKALMSRDHEESDPSNSHNCFAQAFVQLNSKDSSIFRCVSGSDRVFQTSFAGESGIDAGGVFREGLSRIVEDLFSEHFSLLVLCPNAQQQVHSNMDKFLPNPQHFSSPLAIKMFEFVGKLMALSIRTKLSLPFEFPPLIWKKIVGEAVGQDTLAGVDAIGCQQLEAIRVWDLEKFDPSRLCFSYVGSDKVERELLPGGRSVAVTEENRHEYCDSLVAARLSECDIAVDAIRRGMEEVIPSRALLLFSALQLEELVCGCPTFDLDLWKRNTDSTGVSAHTVSLFWQVMGTLTQKELAGFVRFAWGRSRLPPGKEFTTKMRLTSGGSAVLPVSHTCFFSVELPQYQTVEAMRHGLLTAIHYGVGGILNG